MSQQRHVSSASPGGADATARRAAVREPARTGRLALLIFSADAEPRVCLPEQPVTVGRKVADCDVVVDDAAVSRMHARLVPADDSFEVYDLGSRNGTFVDGGRVDRARARAGSILRVGDTLMRVAVLQEAWQPPSAEGPLVGGTSLAGVRRMISLLAPSDLPIAISGETGTGKEVVAQLVHDASGRAGPLVAVNCAALPEALVESELFGHARNAFTGAERGRKGLFLAAAGGTLLLDEIGELPLPAQATLLRVLEDGMVRAVGADAAQRVDVRVLSATNRDLPRAVAAGTFRADLWARLSAAEIRLPPLRDRPEDLPALCRYLLVRAGAADLAIEATALEAMALYEWPHNIRELDNVLRAAALAGGVALDALPERVRDSARPGLPVARASHRPTERELRAELEQHLRVHGGNVRRVSASLGIARSHVYRLMRRLGVDPTAFRGRRARGTNPARTGAAEDA